MQRGRISQADEQRAAGHLLHHRAAGNRYLERSGSPRCRTKLAEPLAEGTERGWRAGKLQFAVTTGETAKLMITHPLILASLTSGEGRAPAR
ncbi:hypothetical protein Aau02nite_72650 [Amorphoplanes auranticolor]|uniref:Uncharacterized protein n=1 Tax=Actinoplanes auranticolor TaxID=47988 RepID=A0A919VU72_9ACTN|nr:hypothetical protein Aau02nite_72650 [Actinoplanes auranticolor]